MPRPVFSPTSSPHHGLSPEVWPAGGCCQFPDSDRGCNRFHSCPLPQGYDPEAKAPFQPKPKQKGRSSTASLVKRKRKVMDEEHRVDEYWDGPGLPQAAPSCLCLCPVSLPLLTVPVSSPSPVPRTRSGRAFSSSSSSSIRKRRPSPRGPGHLPWTDLCAEPDSRVAWEQSLPKITCREKSVPWNKEVGHCGPFPNWGWTAGSWGGLVLKRKAIFWIMCLDHLVDLFPSPLPSMRPF